MGLTCDASHLSHVQHTLLMGPNLFSEKVLIKEANIHLFGVVDSDDNQSGNFVSSVRLLDIANCKKRFCFW